MVSEAMVSEQGVSEVVVSEEVVVASCCRTTFPQGLLGTPDLTPGGVIQTAPSSWDRLPFSVLQEISGMYNVQGAIA